MLTHYVGLIAMGIAGLLSCLCVRLASRWLRGVDVGAADAVMGDSELEPVELPAAVRPSPKLVPVAMLFLVLQAGAIPVLLWSTVFRELGAPGWIAMAGLACALTVGWIYAWSRSTFEC